MNTKFTLTTLVAAGTVAIAGLAFAQGQPPTSTAGAGCTATANAMKGGNLGGTATNKDCVSAGAATAAAPAATTSTTMSAAPAPSTSSSTASTADTSSSTTVADATPRKKMRVARADRN